MYIHEHIDSCLLIMSLLVGVQETRNRPGLEETTAIGEKVSCGMRRTSGELGRYPAESLANDS